jgi:hypothetical protein
MPDNLMDPRALNAVIRLITRPFHVPEEQNFCSLWTIDTIPPRLPLTELSPAQLDRVNKHHRFLHRFLPVEVLPSNISSNAGLSTILADVSKQSTQSPSNGQYHIYVADVNIFERALKVSQMCGLLPFMFVFRSCTTLTFLVRDRYGFAALSCWVCGIP